MDSKGDNMKILGLDMSSKKTGYSYFDGEKLIDYGLWECESGEWRDRIVYMAEKITEFIDHNAIDKIYAEDVPPILDNTQTVKVLSALQGMLMSISVCHDISVEFIPVKTWKIAIGINFVSSKENVRLKRKVGIEFGANATQITKVWAKGWEKKLSVDYANMVHGLQLTYKSPSSKFNEDDIADAINVAYSQVRQGELPICNTETFEDIANRFYSLVQEKYKKHGE